MHRLLKVSQPRQGKGGVECVNLGWRRICSRFFHMLLGRDLVMIGSSTCTGF